MGKLSVLRVGTLNCHGLNDFYKRHAVLDYLQNSSISIFFLQETKIKPEHEIKYSREWNVGPCIFNSVTGRKSGTAVLLKGPGIRFCEGSKMMDIEGKVIAVDVEIFGSKFHVVNSYGPNASGEKYHI